LSSGTGDGERVGAIGVGAEPLYCQYMLDNGFCASLLNHCSFNPGWQIGIAGNN
jgi:hypothetical protein